MKSFEKYYINYLWDKLDEHTLFYQDEFYNALTTLKRLQPNSITDDLYSLYGVDNKNVNVNFVNIDLIDDTKLSFVEDTKIDKLIEDEIDGYGFSDSRKKSEIERRLQDNNYRKNHYKNITPKSIKIGRLAQKLLSLTGKQYRASDVENFVNQFIAFQKEKDASFHFELYKGKDIIKGYDRDEYCPEEGHSDNEYGGGDDYDTVLHQSCMVNKHNNIRDIFNIYTENPDQIGLLTLYKDQYLISRALVWLDVKATDWDGTGRTTKLTFLDRVYYMEDYVLERMRAYAVKNGWAYRFYNTYENKDQIVYKGVKKSMLMKVKLDKADLYHYPYMDTFTYLDPESKTISNKNCFDSYYQLSSTDGDYTNYRRVRTYKGELVTTNEARFSECMQIWIYRYDRVLVTVQKIGGGYDYALKTFDQIIESSDGYYILKKDAIYSDYSEEWYLKDKVIKLGDSFIPMDRSYQSPKIKRLIKEFLLANGKSEENLPTSASSLINKYVSFIKHSGEKYSDYLFK